MLRAHADHQTRPQDAPTTAWADLGSRTNGHARWEAVRVEENVWAHAGFGERQVFCRPLVAAEQHCVSGADQGERSEVQQEGSQYERRRLADRPKRPCATME